MEFYRNVWVRKQIVLPQSLWRIWETLEEEKEYDKIYYINIFDLKNKPYKTIW